MLTSTGTAGNLSLVLTVPDETHQIRIVGTQSRPEWVAVDVCEVLGIKQPTRSLESFDEDEKGKRIVHTLGGPQELLTVTEPGLFRLVLSSRKPQASRVKRWILHEVLPAIREHGCYPPPEGPVNATAIALRQLANTVERQEHLEAQQQEMAKQLDFVTGKVHDMDGDTGYVTLLAYGRLKSVRMPRNDAQKHGKAITKIHRQRDIRIGKVPDERHGEVNAYRIDIIEEYFSEVGQ